LQPKKPVASKSGIEGCGDKTGGPGGGGGEPFFFQLPNFRDGRRENGRDWGVTLLPKGWVSMCRFRACSGYKTGRVGEKTQRGKKNPSGDARRLPEKAGAHLVGRVLRNPLGGGEQGNTAAGRGTPHGSPTSVETLHRHAPLRDPQGGGFQVHFAQARGPKWGRLVPFGSSNGGAAGGGWAFFALGFSVATRRGGGGRVFGGDPGRPGGGSRFFAASGRWKGFARQTKKNARGIRVRGRFRLGGLWPRGFSRIQGGGTRGSGTENGRRRKGLLYRGRGDVSFRARGTGASKTVSTPGEKTPGKGGGGPVGGALKPKFATVAAGSAMGSRRAGRCSRSFSGRGPFHRRTRGKKKRPRKGAHRLFGPEIRGGSFRGHPGEKSLPLWPSFACAPKSPNRSGVK